MPLLMLLLSCAPDPATDAPPDPATDATAPSSTSTGATSAPSTFADGGHTVTVRVTDRDTLQRTYLLTTTQPLRDGAPQTRTVVEAADAPVLRSGNDLFDALFALAVQEAREASVSEIRDGAFAHGAPIPCACFETGELWPFVWTRDTAYAADLGLAWLDPTRARDSLRFKLSEPKQGDGLRIVQDTGTGGGWPVSTDRVVWALGARAVLAQLPDDPFRAEAYEALAHTLTEHRAHVWDARSGLYRGEQSFLDWREQSYPAWTATDPVHIAMSEALSTNVLHLEALRLAAELAADPTEAATWRQQADDLALAIDAGFWREDRAGWSTFRTTWLDRAPVDGHDLLGTALAALHVDGAHGARALGAYPFAHAGPPVIWPQQPSTPIYHNRAIWPFVTAYAARAAAAVDQPAVFDRAVASLVRGAALNLSNMENFELETGLPWVDDGPWSGPVVNSRRQLWSVAGYLSAVLEIFGVDGAPYVTPEVHRAWLAGSRSVTLHRARWEGRLVDLTLQLPDVSAGGAYAVGAIAEGQDRVTFDLAAGGGAEGAVTALPSEIVAPRTPTITGVWLDGTLRLTFEGEGTFDVYRDGARVAEGVGASWSDPGATEHATRTYCYTVASRSPAGLRSPHAPPVCWWGGRVQVFGPHDLVTEGGVWATDHGRPHHADWGAPADTLRIAAFRPNWTGEHLVQPVAGNGSGPISTGITAGHKRVVIREAATGALVAEGSWVMPQLGSWSEWRDGSFVPAWLDADVTYTLEVTDAPNASGLAAFASYTGGLGGGPEPLNAVNVAEIKLLAMSGNDRTPVPAVGFDGVDDLGKIDPAHVTGPGVALQPWSGFGLQWDAHWLYVAVVSSAFEDPWRPFVLYLEASASPLPPAVPGQGMAYDGLVPNLPFTPTHTVAMRNQTEDGTGPWDGVWRHDVRELRFERGVTEWLAADAHTLSVRVPRALLGDVRYARIAGHVVHAAPGQEWKEVVPAGHTPWTPSTSGFWEIDLEADGGVATWTER